VQVEPRLELPPGCFYPVPRVRSTFLRITPLALPRLAAGELEVVEAFLRRAFGKRRKTLANALREPAASSEATLRALDCVGVDRRARAEQLSAEELLEVARALRAEPA
jgi:16S rRNA (adenine1518-N6/adenine1519-N6)-dimethyltransferase